MQASLLCVPPLRTVTRLPLDARTLSKAAFRRRHGDAFLLPIRTVESIPNAPEPAHRAVSAVIYGGERIVPDIDIVAFALASRSQGRFNAFVSIGRTPNNDIVLRDTSVAKFHAYLRRRSIGYTLHDATSFNGTTVNGERVSGPLGMGHLLVNGDCIEIGGIELTFLSAAFLQSLVAAFEP